MSKIYKDNALNRRLNRVGKPYGFVSEKECAQGKILNPKSNRCVNKDGKIGKELDETITKIDNFNDSIDNLPPNVTHLSFADKFNKPVDNLKYLKHLTHITFGYKFNQPVDNLPESLIDVTFGAKFNKPVDKLPKNLKHLTFDRGGAFTRTVDKLPDLTHLTFGFNFNRSVDKLPKTLIYLKFGDKFNKHVYKSLPQLTNLTHLIFGFNFNKPIDHLKHLKNLTHLTFGHDFNQPLIHLPKSLRHLIIRRHYEHTIPSMKNLKVEIV